MNTSRLIEFIFKQKCVPWRVSYHLKDWRENWLRTHSWRLYRFIKYGRLNINNRKYWNSIWTNGGSFVSTDLLSNAIDLVPIGSKVLDIGCGSGFLLEKLRREKGCDVWGLDISDAVILDLKRKGFQGVVSKLPKIPFPDEFFDVVVSTEVLEHIPNPGKTILQMIRTLRKGGLLIISVPDDTLHPEEEVEHINVFNERSLKEMLVPFVKISDTYRAKYFENGSHCYLMILGHKI